MTNGDKIRGMTDKELAEFLQNAEISMMVPGFCMEVCEPVYGKECDEDSPYGECKWYRDENDKLAWEFWLSREIGEGE